MSITKSAPANSENGKGSKPDTSASNAAPKKVAKKAVIKDKSTVRLGTLNLPENHYKEVKNGVPQSGKTTEEGKNARTAIKDYFARQFGLDIVTKFTPTANEGENGSGFMIIARSLDKKKSKLFSTGIKLNHKRGNFIELKARADGKVNLPRLDSMNEAVADALREYRDINRA